MRLMGNKQSDKAPKPAPKSFMTVGPTLHYSHKNVQRCWLLALVAFVAGCLFWTKLITGSLWAFNLNTIASLESLHLGRFVVNGISIFEYPWQILVLGLLMGILAIVPPLISQLMSFSWSLPFILAVGLLANLPGFALCLLISCIAVASRPLRFRSRFISRASKRCRAYKVGFFVYSVDLCLACRSGCRRIGFGNRTFYPLSAGPGLDLHNSCAFNSCCGLCTKDRIRRA